MLDVSLDLNSWASLQKASLYNAISENILAVMLLYARLHQQDSAYSYKNEDAVRNCSFFLKDVLNAFLDGYLGDSDSKETVWNLMNLTECEYEKWLDFTVRRFIYWTMVQGPYIDCYTRDLNRKRKLDEDLFPESIPPTKLSKQYDKERGFCGMSGSPMLATDANSGFVLHNLTEGLFTFCVGLEQRDK